MVPDSVRDYAFPSGFKHNLIGNSWKVTDDGEWFLPERTLGWEFIEFASRYYLNQLGDPFVLTDEQLRLVLWLYALNEDGSFQSRESVIQRMKGHGKDPLAMAVGLFEMCGNCRFSHWDEEGRPVGRPHPSPRVAIAAVSEGQAKETLRVARWMVSDALRHDYGVDIGQSAITGLRGRARIDLVSASFRSAEGKPISFAIYNEALAIDTPIPTPSGWARMGDLAAGDVVFGKDGAPTEVTAVKPVQTGRDCYRVALPNGEFAVASDGHLWSTRLARSAAKPRVRTTREMFEDGRRFMVPRAGAREFPEADLPVDPYVLGYWLGDGSTGSCNIAVGREDLEAVPVEFAKRGVELRKLRSREGQTDRLSFSNREGFGADMGGPTARALRKMPCYRDKHVPDEYKTASVSQRLELLRGLMDSDGCSTGTGQAVFVGTERLSQDAFDLLMSLGFLPFRTFAPDTRSRVGGSYRVNFLVEGFNPFSLPRKAGRVPVKRRREWVSVTVEAVESVPVRCISVAADDSLFQAGRGVVTHNTHHWVTGNGGTELYDTLEGNVAKGGHGLSRRLHITNAFMPGEDSVAERTRRAYEDQVARFEATGRLPAIYYDSLEADYNASLDAETARVVIPEIRGDSVWLDPESIIEGFILKTSISPQRSRRMQYNQITTAADSLFDKGDLDAGADRIPLRKGEVVALGFDGARRRDSTALIACRVSDRKLFTLAVWEKPDKAVDDDWWLATDVVDSAVQEAFASFQVVAFYADVNLWESEIAAWSDQFRDRLTVRASSMSAIGYDMRGNLKKTTAGNEMLVATSQAKALKHDGNGTLVRHFLNVRRRHNKFGVSFGKESRDSPNKIDAYAAALLAFMAANDVAERGKIPEPKKSRRLLRRR